MKNSIITLSFFLSSLLFSQAQTVEITNLQETYALNTSQSVINWKGTYAFQFSEHNGTVDFKIDRRDRKINYNSKFKNSTIADAIEFDVMLQF